MYVLITLIINQAAGLGFIFKPSSSRVTSRAISETLGDIALPNWQLSCIFHSKLFVTFITKYLANLFVTDVAQFTGAYVQPRGKRVGGGWGWRSDQRRRLIKTDCSRIVLSTLPARVLNEVIDLVRSFVCALYGGKPSSRWKDAADWLQLRDWKAAARSREGWRKEIGEAMARKRAEAP